jgi:hypothetical protein
MGVGVLSWRSPTGWGSLRESGRVPDPVLDDEQRPGAWVACCVHMSADTRIKQHLKNINPAYGRKGQYAVDMRIADWLQQTENRDEFLVLFLDERDLEGLGTQPHVLRR